MHVIKILAGAGLATYLTLALNIEPYSKPLHLNDYLPPLTPPSGFVNFVMTLITLFCLKAYLRVSLSFKTTLSFPQLNKIITTRQLTRRYDLRSRPPFSRS